MSGEHTHTQALTHARTYIHIYKYINKNKKLHTFIYIHIHIMGRACNCARGRRAIDGADLAEPY